MKTSPVKNVNDFVIGLALLVLGCYVLLTDNIIFGVVPRMGGGIHPEAYVRLIGGILTGLSAILVLRSLNWRRSAQVIRFRFIITRHIVLTVVSLVAYTFLLPRIGFVISTFLLNFFLSCLFLHRERTGEGQAPFEKKEIIRSLINITIYSVVLLIVIYLLFTRVLFVNLP